MLKKLLSFSFVKYALVGVINTIIGFGIIFLLMYFKVIPEVANVVGYLCGFIVSYFLNKHFTFKSKNSHKKDFIKFTFAMGISYIINLIVLVVSHRYFGIDKYISQVLAGISYTLSGYLLSKYYAFRYNPKF